jgi:nucleotide-binding universal stress UspA family protein
VGISPDKYISEVVMIENILLATDGSSPANRAADFAASLALRFRAKVTVLHAYTPVPAHLGEPNFSRALYETLDEAKALVENAAGRLREMGIVEVETDVIEGPAANAILGVAETRKPDLIVIGARGLSTWQGILMGSVSMSVTQRAECPVLVMK